MNKYIPNLCVFVFFVLSAFTTNIESSNSPLIEEVSSEISVCGKEIELMANCCGVINIAQPICTGTITFSFTLVPVGGGAVTNLNIGSNNVEVIKGGKYVLSYTTIDPGAPSPCLPVSVSWVLCGSSGSATLNPSATIRVGKGFGPCFGF